MTGTWGQGTSGLRTAYVIEFELLHYLRDCCCRTYTMGDETGAPLYPMCLPENAQKRNPTQERMYRADSLVNAWQRRGPPLTR